MGKERSKKTGKESLIGLVDSLPDRVRDAARTRGRSIRDFRSAEDTSNGEIRRTSLNAGSMRGGGGEGLGGKKC